MATHGVLATFKDNDISSAEVTSESDNSIHIYSIVYSAVEYIKFVLQDDETILYNLLSLPNLGRELINVTLCIQAASEFQFG